MSKTRFTSAPGRLLLAGLTTLLVACGGGGGTSGDGPGAVLQCDETSRKQWVLDVTREWYLFPELLPAQVDLAAFGTADELLDALTATAREQGKDRNFSYLTTPAEENAVLQAGQFAGFGFRTRTDAGNRPFLLDVFEQSPAAEAGLQRGDEIIAVDEDSGAGYTPVAELLVDGRTISDLLGPAEAGVQRGLRIRRGADTFDVRMTKRTVTIDPVPDSFGVAVLPLAGTSGVGYVHLRSYTATAPAQLRAAFAELDDPSLQLQSFIVDLRYNGGGYVDVAETLNNLLGGNRSSLDVQYGTVHNAAKSQQNSQVRFRPEDNSVAPVRIAFLTTAATASASELNINSMKPWAEVAIIGADTEGKPVGQLAFDRPGGCEDRLRLVAFKTVNSLGEGDYYSGLASTMKFACAAEDTLTAPMGGVEDNLTRAALHWLATGTCESVIEPAFAGQSKPWPELATPYPRPLQPSAAEHWLPGIH